MSVSRFFTFNNNLELEQTDEVKRVGELKLVEQVCSVETPDDWEIEGELIKRDLSTLIPKTYVKGKLELCFFVKFIDKFWHLLQQKIIDTGKSGSVSIKTPLSEENAVEILGPRLALPQSLEIFLRRNLLEASQSA